MSATGNTTVSEIVNQLIDVVNAQSNVIITLQSQVFWVMVVEGVITVFLVLIGAIWVLTRFLKIERRKTTNDKP